MKESNNQTNTAIPQNSFSGKLGFILAAAGSAVGLGNIWRFPYLAAKYGGGIFLLVYLILAITFGFSLMVTEIAIGRKTGNSPIEAYTKLNSKFKFLGILASAVPIIIFPYYCVIGGWIIKYLKIYLTGQAAAAATDTYFGGFIGQSAEPILCLAIFMVLTAAVVIFGVQKGIERISKIMMPVLVVLSLVTAIYCLTLDGAMQGLVYYLKPNFSLFSVKTIVAAAGQLFYSMSLAMGIMITYGSYMRKEDNIEQSVRHIEIFDTAIAFISGLMIIPAVFVFSGGNEEALQAGPTLMFVMLPKVFNAMPAGAVIGLLFFVLVLFAALTSAISLMETIVSIFMDKLGWNRIVACIVVFAFALIMALPSSLGFGVWSGITILGRDILSFFDFISNNIMMPIVALVTSILIGFIVKPQSVIEEVELNGKFKSKALYVAMIRYVVPIVMVVILISSVIGYV